MITVLLLLFGMAGLSSHVYLDGIDERKCLQKVIFGAPEILEVNIWDVSWHERVLMHFFRKQSKNLTFFNNICCNSAVEIMSHTCPFFC